METGRAKESTLPVERTESAGRLRVLLEAVQDIYRFLKFDDIHYRVNAVALPGTDFPLELAGYFQASNSIIAGKKF